MSATSYRVAVIRGTGDVGSAVAVLLSRAGYRVVMHDGERPAHTRRGMSFVDALYDGCAELAGTLGKRARSRDDLPHMVRCGRAVPISPVDAHSIVDVLRPDVVVDARMRKRATPEKQLGLAAITIGLGPNFEAGANVDVAIETAWGDELGAVVRVGKTKPLEGEPQPIGGHARDRYVYSPAAGTFTTSLRIGDAVLAGQVIAHVGQVPVHAPIGGCLRGLSHDGAAVSQRTKIIEVDPRGDPARAYGLGERPLRIAQGVLEALGHPESPSG